MVTPKTNVFVPAGGVLLRDAVGAVSFFLAVSQGIQVCAGACIPAALLIFLFPGS